MGKISLQHHMASGHFTCVGASAGASTCVGCKAWCPSALLHEQGLATAAPARRTATMQQKHSRVSILCLVDVQHLRRKNLGKTSAGFPVDRPQRITCLLGDRRAAGNSAAERKDRDRGIFHLAWLTRHESQQDPRRRRRIVRSRHGSVQRGWRDI